MTTDVLIVGGGIGGLVLAELLGRGGKRVVVLERSTGPPAWSRPEILWPATIELLCSLLPKARWEECAAVPLAGIEFFDGRAFRWAIPPETLDRAGVHPWSTDPNQTRELLMRLESFELHRGQEVVEILKEGERIVGARTKDAASGQTRDWLGERIVGDDGANSLVRKACNVELAVRFLPLDLLAFACEWPAAFRPDTGHLWSHPRGPRSGLLVAGLLPAPGGRGVGLVPARPRLFDDLPRAQETWRELVRSEPTLESLLGNRTFPDDFQRIRRPWGHARRYGAAGALLMGDAAHPVSPAGGQGANMSVADGRAIAELVLAGQRDLLAAYERVRRRANRRSLRFTRAAAFAFGLPEWVLASPLLLGLVGPIVRRTSFQSWAIHTVSTAFLSR